MSDDVVGVAPEVGSRVAFVTGAGSGIGRAIALRLAEDGLPIAVVDLSEDAAKTVADELPAEGPHRAGGGRRRRVRPLGGRGRRRAGAGRARADPRPREQRGRSGFSPFLKITDEEWDSVLHVNLDGPFYCAQTVLPDMIGARWGRIVNISSSSAQGGQPYMAHYVSSKAGLIGMTKSLALEFGPKGITVNTIPPGFIDTPMLRESEEQGLLGGSVEKHAGLTPVRRAGLPEDIANATAFLASDEAGYVTGQVIGVNGGRNT